MKEKRERAELCSIPFEYHFRTSSTFKRKVVEFFELCFMPSCNKKGIMQGKSITSGGVIRSRHVSQASVIEDTLLEDLAVGELVGLAVDDDGLVPGPHVVDVLPVLRLGGVELGELVGGNVGSDLKGGGGVLATDDEGTLDDGVVGLAEDGTGTEDVLAAALETGEEATDLVVAHEGHGELVVVEVVEAPDRELVELAVLPEPGKGDLTGLLVGVLALPVRLVRDCF